MKHQKVGNFLKRLGAILKGFLIATGTIFTVMVILAFTSAPFWTWYGMGIKKAGIKRPPDYIVLLGGGGMPSESGLMRSWFTARAAGYFTHSTVIIAMPGEPSDSLSAVSLMKKELVMRGVVPDRIELEDAGTNTRSQALNLYKRISNIDQRGLNVGRIQNTNRQSSIVHRQSSILLVTSPEHLYRAVLTFEKAGFKNIEGLPAFERAIDSDISFNDKKLGGRKFIPEIGNNITLRYQFWTQMNYELLILRECAALGYYKLKGWI